MCRKAYPKGSLVQSGCVHSVLWQAFACLGCGQYPWGFKVRQLGYVAALVVSLYNFGVHMHSLPFRSVTPADVAGMISLLERLSNSPGPSATAGAPASSAADSVLQAALFAQAQAQSALAGQQLSRTAGVAPLQLEQSLFASVESVAPTVSPAAAAAAGGVSLPGLHNGNVDLAFPGATAAASGLLASGAVPAAGVASASLEGGLVAGHLAGLVPLPPSWSLYAHRGPFGSMRGPLLLVCAFLPGASSVAQVHLVEEVGTGGEVRSVSRVLLSIDKVLERCPSYAHFMPTADAWYFAALQRKYLLVHEVAAYGVFVSRMRDAYVALSDAAGFLQGEAMRAFLELDRRLRVSQHSSGAPWDQTFKEAELCRALVSLQLRVARPPPSPGSQGKGKGGSSGGAPGGGRGRCFQFDASKEVPPSCPAGANCRYAAHHSCRVCGSSEHVTKACPRSGGGDA